ncbi:MAG: DUF116 domain-containing protein [Candidatus Eisenbacteria bacterium]|nr:DUF116 domain-containing protein [Candidatus Eisenbacteria bacterium]
MGGIREKVRRSRDYLGNAWEEWDGDLTRYDWKVDTPKGTFLLLFALFWIAAVGVLWLAWYLILPRLQSFHPRAPLLSGLLFLVGGATVVLVSLSVILSVLTNRNLLVTRLALFMLILAAKPMARIAGRFGLSQDRVWNSFLKIHNLLVRFIDGERRTDKILVLLPRCLAGDARKRLTAIAERYRCLLYTAGGGSEALAKVRSVQPRAIVAVACERDLISGIRDVGTNIPVLAIPNIRDNGPCRITHVDSEEFERAVRFFTEGTAPAEAEPATANPV